MSNCWVNAHQANSHDQLNKQPFLAHTHTHQRTRTHTDAVCLPSVERTYCGELIELSFVSWLKNKQKNPLDLQRRWFCVADVAVRQFSIGAAKQSNWLTPIQSFCDHQTLLTNEMKDACVSSAVWFYYTKRWSTDNSKSWFQNVLQPISLHAIYWYFSVAYISLPIKVTIQIKLKGMASKRYNSRFWYANRDFV